MKWQPIVLALGATLLLSACESEKVEVMKSPCVGIDGSPCGPKRPVNGVLNPTLMGERPQAS
jgi:hypothetical protein